MSFLNIAEKFVNSELTHTEVNLIVQAVNDIEGRMGWVNYADTQYTTGSPFSLTKAAGKVSLPNNAGSIIDTEKPLDLPNGFYDGTKLLGLQGDAYEVDIEMKVRSTGPGADARLYTSIDIGGAVGEIFPRDFNLVKGSGNEHYYLSHFMYYTFDTFEANGGTIKVQAVNENLEIYDIRYLFNRMYKARGNYGGGGLP